MRRHWWKRHFGWVVEDFRYLFAELRERHTWVFIAIASLFSTLVFYGTTLALRMDFTVRLQNLGDKPCNDIENLGTAFLFVGTTLLFLTITMVFGEFGRHLDYKRRQAKVQARQSALSAAGWGTFGVLTGVAMVAFLKTQCP